MAVEKLQALRTNIQPDNTQTHHTEAPCNASRSTMENAQHKVSVIKPVSSPAKNRLAADVLDFVTTAVQSKVTIGHMVALKCQTPWGITKQQYLLVQNE